MADSADDKTVLPTPGLRAVQRRVGITQTERELGRLADQTFLRLWSYAGVYRNQNGSGREGKELCDLLVVFGDHIVIFSDKQIEFQHNQALDLAWARWYRRALKESSDQVFGAERWLRDYPERVFLDPDCTQLFPIPIPPKAQMKVHRVLVARGAGKAISRHFGSSRGSLMLDSSLKGNDHISENAAPFVVGQIAPERGFLHVLDDATLNIVLATLTTIQDLIDYLMRKEALFINGPVVFATGEEELLGHYLRDIGADGKNDFIFTDNPDCVLIEEGTWDALQAHPQRRAQLEADSISYAWDELIERFAEHLLNDTQYDSYGLANPLEAEAVLRFMARENRTRRRILATQFLGLVNRFGENDAWKVRLAMPSNPGDPVYVFAVSQRPKSIDYGQFRKARMQRLTDYMQCAKLVAPSVDQIIGIAVGHPSDDDNSEDLAHLDTTSWTNLDYTHAQQLQSKTGYLTNLKRFEAVEKTYPDAPCR